MQLALLIALTLAGPSDDVCRLAEAHRQAQVYLKAYAALDHERLADLAVPGDLQKHGGRERWADGMRRTFAQYAQRRLRIINVEVQHARALHRVGKDLVAFLPLRERIGAVDHVTVRDDHLIAASADAGKTWKFLRRGGLDERQIHAIFPAWPMALRLPLPMRDTTEDPTPGRFTSVKHNCRLSYPERWQRAFGPDPDDCTLDLGRVFLRLTADHTNPAPEEQLRELLDKLRQDTKEQFKELGRTKARVGGPAGAAATIVHFTAARPGDPISGRVALFEHEGITYRLIGIAPPEQDRVLATDFPAILAGFAFLGPRPEWRKLHEGPPARTAFLAGLASVEVRRPRWRETTCDDRYGTPIFNPPGPGTGALEMLTFKLFNDAAYINVWTYDQRSSARAELDELQSFLEARLEQATARRVAVKGPKGFVAAVEVTGQFQRQKHHLLGCVFVQDGYAVHLCLECAELQRPQVQRDWEQLVASFRLEDAKQTPPLFPVRAADRRDHYYDGDYGTGPNERPPHPALAVLLKKATPLFASQRLHEIHSISADGHQALLRGTDGMAVESLLDRTRTPLKLRFSSEQPVFGVPAAWSRDGKQLAYATMRSVVVLTVGAKDTIDHAGRPSALAFLPDDRLLVAQEPAAELAPRFAQQKLLRYDDEETSQTLLAFPLARFAHLAVSPDGKQLALVTNRDAPRTSFRPGNLYVGTAEAGDLRQLTRGPETIRSVAWSEDGRWLYVVRRPLAADGADLDFRAGGDLYRIDPATAQANNLTRCGLIDAAWVQGEHFLLRVPFTDQVASAQAGIWKIAHADLVGAGKALPEPRPGDGRQQAKQIAERIAAAFAPRRLAELTPTPELMEQLARSFADAAGDVLGEQFDFSARSLDALPRWTSWLQPGNSGQPALVFCMGAYYGETLRRVQQAQWRLEPVPLGEWLPGRTHAGNLLIDVVLPFSDLYHAGSGGYLPGTGVRPRGRERQLILAYPPAAAQAALDAATPPAYRRARAHLDKGELKPGLEQLALVVRAFPGNLALAQEALELAALANEPAVVERMATDAVAAGSELPEWVARRADASAASDPAQALALYRKAVRSGRAPTELYLKLGKLLTARGERPLAEACFRRAFLLGTTSQRGEAAELMGVAKDGTRK